MSIGLRACSDPVSKGVDFGFWAVGGRGPGSRSGLGVRDLRIPGSVFPYISSRARGSEMDKFGEQSAYINDVFAG